MIAGARSNKTVTAQLAQLVGWASAPSRGRNTRPESASEDPSYKPLAG